MKVLAAFIACLVVALCSTSNAAPDVSSAAQQTRPLLPGQRDGYATVPDFHFADGEELKDLRLHYITLGSPHRGHDGKIDNAVLLLHSTGDDATLFLPPNGEEIARGKPDFWVLFREGQPLDLSRFYVILPDSIGHGRSSKPSDGLRAHFPHYGYRDMVNAQDWLVTKHLGVDHLRLVLGVSMGGMHTWLWGEMYPTMMDALFPISALPVETGGRNRLWRHAIVEAIRNDPEWNGGNYAKEPEVWSRMAPLVVIMTGNPERQFERYPTRQAADVWYEQIHSRFARGDANNALYTLNASSDYDPEPALGTISARLHLILFADDQINSPEFSVLAREMPRVKHGQYTIIPTNPMMSGEGRDNTNATLWKAQLDALLRVTNTR